MNTYKINYVVNKHCPDSTIVSAPTLTMAYLEFLVRFSDECEIVEITLKED